MGERPKNMLKNPLKQLIFRLRTIISNHNLRAETNFVMNKIGIGSTFCIKCIHRNRFDKIFKKFNKRLHQVDGFVNGNVMIKVSGEDRPLRPLQILPVLTKVETNPYKPNTKALNTKWKGTEVRRIRNDALIR